MFDQQSPMRELACFVGCAYCALWLSLPYAVCTRYAFDTESDVMLPAPAP